MIRKKKVCVDCGHGDSATGGSYGSVNEKDIVLLIGLVLKEELLLRGYDVVMPRTTDKYVSLTGRAQYANKNEADIFISLHTNADPDEDFPNMPEASGEEIWVYQPKDGNKSAKGMGLALAIEDEVDQIFPNSRSRGIKGGRFTVLKKTTMPAVLVELGFIDNRREFTGLSHMSTPIRIAGLLAKGIDDYFHNE